MAGPGARTRPEVAVREALAEALQARKLFLVPFKPYALIARHCGNGVLESQAEWSYCVTRL